MSTENSPKPSTAIDAIVEEIVVRLIVLLLSIEDEWLWKYHRFFSALVKEGKVDNRFILLMDKYLSEAILATKQTIAHRVKRDVDTAIEAYQKEVPPVIVAGPVFTEEPPDGSVAQDLLGGEMRSTYLFYDKENNEM